MNKKSDRILVDQIEYAHTHTQNHVILVADSLKTIVFVTWVVCLELVGINL